MSAGFISWNPWAPWRPGLSFIWPYLFLPRPGPRLQSWLRRWHSLLSGQTGKGPLSSGRRASSCFLPDSGWLTFPVKGHTGSHSSSSPPAILDTADFSSFGSRSRYPFTATAHPSTPTPTREQPRNPFILPCSKIRKPAEYSSSGEVRAGASGSS